MLVALILGSFGYWSWRALQSFPDSPERRRLLDGAKWGWAVYTMALVVPAGVSYLGVTHTIYLLTSLVAYTPLMLLLMHLATTWDSGRINDGLWAGPTLLMRRRRGKEMDLAQWLAEDKRKGRKGLIIYKASTVVVVALWLAVILAIAYPCDRATAQMLDQEDLAQAVMRQLDSPRVERVLVSPADAGWDAWWKGHAGECAIRSLRAIVLGQEPAGTRPSAAHPFDVLVRVEASASRADADKVLEDTRRALAACGEAGPYRIRVYAHGTGKSISGMYPAPLRPLPKPPKTQPGGEDAESAKSESARFREEAPTMRRVVGEPIAGGWTRPIGGAA
jgi:hypothetical protein